MRHSDDKDADTLRGSEEFKVGGLSRRGFLDRMKALGVGFGAAYMLGVTDAAAAVPSGGSVRIRSNDEAVNSIIEESDDAASRSTIMADAVGEEETKVNKYSRGYSKGYSRDYSRGYSRDTYSRGYSRAIYSRGYSRGGYSRGYSRGSHRPGGHGHGGYRGHGGRGGHGGGGRGGRGGGGRR